MTTAKRFVRRSEKVNFLKVDTEYVRMKNFKSMGSEKNPIEYTRQYIDEPFEVTDIVGLSPSIAWEMDQRLNDPAHELIVDIIDNEKLGDDASVTILSVDFTKPVGTDGTEFEAKERNFSLIAGSEGGELEAYTYDGTFRAKGSTVSGVATFATAGPINELESCTFTEGSGE